MALALQRIISFPAITAPDYRPNETPSRTETGNLIQRTRQITTFLLQVTAIAHLINVFYFHEGPEQEILIRTVS